jgi:hypothetical protein
LSWNSTSGCTCLSTSGEGKYLKFSTASRLSRMALR